MKSWITYQAVNQVNGHRYVGMTGQSLAGRRCGHKAAMLRGKRKTKFTSALRAYGFDAFQFSILERYASRAEMAAGEIRLIALLKPEYNLGPGGESAVAPPPQQFAAFMQGRARACERRKKPVICLSDGRIFASSAEAAEVYGISRAALCLALKGRNASAAGLLFSYYSGQEEPLADPELAMRQVRDHQRALMVANTPRRRVVRISDQKTYRSVSEAANELGLTVSALWHRIDRAQSANGEMFAWAQG